MNADAKLNTPSASWTSSGFTPQLTDPVRVELGMALIVRELRKILPESKQGELQRQLNERFNNLTCDTNLRDFWNLAYSLTKCLKLKNLVRFITLQNFQWRLESLDTLDDLFFTTDFPIVRCNGLSFAELRNQINIDPQLARVNAERAADIYDWRADSCGDPLVILHSNDKKEVVDGNGRLFRSMYTKEFATNAYIGRRINYSKQNYWVPTSLIFELMEIVELTRSPKGLVFIFRESDNAFHEFVQFANRDSKLMQVALEQYLKE